MNPDVTAMLTDLREGEAEREQWGTDPFMSVLTPCDPTFHQLCPKTPFETYQLKKNERSDVSMGALAISKTATSAGYLTNRHVSFRVILINETFIKWSGKRH